MGDYKDQQQNPISEDELFTQLSEAILANPMVFDAAGISQGTDDYRRSRWRHHYRRRS